MMCMWVCVCNSDRRRRPEQIYLGNGCGIKFLTRLANTIQNEISIFHFVGFIHFLFDELHRNSLHSHFIVYTVPQIVTIDTYIHRIYAIWTTLFLTRNDESHAAACDAPKMKSFFFYYLRSFHSCNRNVVHLRMSTFIEKWLMNLVNFLFCFVCARRASTMICIGNEKWNDWCSVEITLQPIIGSKNRV